MPRRGSAQVGPGRNLLFCARGHRPGRIRMSGSGDDAGAAKDRRAARMIPAFETFTDGDALAAAAGERLIGVIDAAAAARGRALIVLTGGGNGNRLLRYLGAQGQRIDWAKVHLFWGDE